jgi:hypothetical protein
MTAEDLFQVLFAFLVLSNRVTASPVLSVSCTISTWRLVQNSYAIDHCS